jgi:putative membrane protein insertion efficiency factor
MTLSRLAARILIVPIRAYQAVHVAFFRGSCRFHPTCSHYAVEALELHGPLRGSWLALARIVRCQPFCRGGFDPVPEPDRNRRDATGPRAQEKPA